MRLIDWFKNLKWIRAIIEYDDLSTKIAELRQSVMTQMNECTILKEQNYALMIEQEALLVKIKSNDAMSTLCKSIDEHMNGSLRERSYRVVDGKRMSKLTWHEEKLLRIENNDLKRRLTILAGKIK